MSHEAESVNYKFPNMVDMKKEQNSIESIILDIKSCFYKHKEYKDWEDIHTLAKDEYSVLLITIPRGRTIPLRSPLIKVIRNDIANIIGVSSVRVISKDYLNYIEQFEVSLTEKVINAAREAAREEADMYAQNELKRLKNLGRLIDLCFELLPEKQQTSILNEINGKSVSEIFINNSFYYLRDHRYDSVSFPQYNILGFYECSELEQIKSIANCKKNKHYTNALMNTISLIVNSPYTKIRSLYFIGELFLEIGVIDSALSLYQVDKGFFNNPNILSSLTNNAIKLGRLDVAIKLASDLVANEPYHPSIPILQAEIKRLQQRDRLKSTFSIDFSKIDELSGVEFENLILDKFSSLGFKVESTPKTGDFGADLIVENNEGSRVIIQCKRFKSKVNLKAVQEVVGAMGHYAGDIGIVITNNSFLNSAIKLAESHDIELWDGESLVSFLSGDLSFSKMLAQH